MKTLVRLAVSAADRAGRDAPESALEDALGLAALSLMVVVVVAATALA